MARFHAVLFALGMVLMLWGTVGARAVEGQQRDLFDQLLHKYIPGYNPGGESLQWSVHPLPRQAGWKRQNSPISLLPSSAAGSDEEDVPTAPPVSLAGLMGTNAGNAIPASVLAAAAAPAQTNSNSADPGTSPDRSTTPSTTPASASASASATASASASASPSMSVSASVQTSASAVPLSKLITSASSTPSSTTASTTVSPTPTKDAQQSDNPSSSSSPSLLNPKNKLFPLIVAGLACAGILAIMLLIAIARAIAHDQLRRDNLRKSYSFDPTSPAEKGGKADRFTSAPPGVGAARSVRRALTKKKLGSFARRTQDGSVLIEVGDEVFAVPPHLADSYREKILRERRSRSDLSGDGGLFGNVKPRYLSDGGPDVDEEQARMAYDSMLNGGGAGGASGGGGVGRSLSQRITDRLRSLRGVQNDEKDTADRAFSFNTDHQPQGGVRQANLASHTPVLTNAPSSWTINPSRGELHKTPHHDKGEGFGTAKVFPRTSSHLPHTTTNKPTTEKVQQPSAAHVKPQQRKPPPKLELTLLTEKLQDLEKQSSSSTSSSLSVDASPTKRSKGRLPKEASLTHSQPSSAASANGTFGGSASGSDVSANLPGAFPERTKSLLQSQPARRARSIKPLILNMEGETQRTVGGYRHRQPASAQRSHTQIQHDRAARATQLERKRTTVPLASPTRFTHDPSPRAVVHPAKPEPSATAGAFRPLPVPPPFHLPK